MLRDKAFCVMAQNFTWRKPIKRFRNEGMHHPPMVAGMSPEELVLYLSERIDIQLSFAKKKMLVFAGLFVRNSFVLENCEGKRKLYLSAPRGFARLQTCLLERKNI